MSLLSAASSLIFDWLLDFNEFAHKLYLDSSKIESQGEFTQHHETIYIAYRDIVHCHNGVYGYITHRFILMQQMKQHDALNMQNKQKCRTNGAHKSSSSLKNTYKAHTHGKRNRGYENLNRRKPLIIIII